MGTTYGRQVLDQVGASIQVAADGRPVMKSTGVTIDWVNLVSAVTQDTYLQDGVFVPNGEKYLRYGQVITRVLAAAQVQTLTETGTPTGGTFTLTGTHPLTGVTTTTAAIPYNATAAQVQPQMDAIYGAAVTTVAGGPFPGTPITVTFPGIFANLPTVLVLANNSLTGGTTPTVTAAISTPGNTSGGLWGPFDPTATDGRQNVVRGQSYILNGTIREVEWHSNHPPCLEGGLVWKQRILMTTGTPSLAAGPAVSAVEAAFPLIRYASPTA